jgi:hypothetical protein
LGNQKDKRGFLAILHGLMTIATTKTIPRDDQEFQVLLENVRDLLRKNLGVDV